MSDGHVRPMRFEERAVVTAMMHSLWPAAGDYDFSDERVFVWEQQDQGLGGFISFSIRPWAEGCESTPVPYIEGLWVAPHLRKSGVATKLVAAAEEWCVRNGFTELGSDVEVSNEISQKMHTSLGFEPTMRLQFFRKVLR
jgi:aminoglycoside 6'-N-acetyltransferase I